MRLPNKVLAASTPNAGTGRPVSPLIRALKADALLTVVIIGGIAMFMAVAAVGLVEQTIDVNVLLSLIGGVISGSVTVLGVVAVRAQGKGDDHK